MAFLTSEKSITPSVYHQAATRPRGITRPSPLSQSTTLDQLQDEQIRSTTTPKKYKTASDVQNVLAAFHKLETLYNVKYKPLISGDHDPEDKALTKQLEKMPKLQEGAPSILKKALDALASFCVPRPDEAVAVAVALEAWYAKKTGKEWVRLHIATDDRVGEESKQQLRLIWKFMKDIASAWHRASSVEKFLQETPELIEGIFRLCFSFSFGNWKKGVNSKLARLLDVPLDGFPESHPFRKVRENIRLLHALHTGAKPKIGKPDAEDREGWRKFSSSLAETQASVEVFFKSNPFKGPKSHVYAYYFPSMETYLRKVTAYLDMVQYLQIAACSDECANLLKRPFTVYALPAINNTVRNVPYMANDWKEVLENAASIKPKKYKLDLGIVSKDAEYMAEDSIPHNAPVHCELKLVLEAMRRPQNVYAYIGVSKLSCYGCHIFLQALNHVYATRFRTKGCTGRASYPWQFPQGMLFSKQLADQTYQLLAKSYLKVYNGYRPRHVSPRPNLANPSVQSAVADGVAPLSSGLTTSKEKKNQTRRCSGRLARCASNSFRRLSSLLGPRRGSSSSQSDQRIREKLLRLS